ncbi:MAG: sugar phosphate isomerase/epimerase [Bryobacteraceae bacterium]|nr:sugar phosphate isomerase/epimerase [Bryobacteraceae bacterium]
MSRSTRRAFFATVAGAASAAGMAKEKVVVGAHPWVYAAPRPKNDIYEILDQIFGDMAYAGMDFIELMHTALEPDGVVDRIRELSGKHKLPVGGASYGADMWKREEKGRIVEYADRMIERLRQVGGRTIGVSVGNARRPKTDDELDTQAEVLRAMMARAAKHGMVINLHNHIYEVENGEHDLKGTLARIPDVKLGPDIDWLVGAGVDPVDFINRYGDRIVYAHLRDRKSDGVWSEAMGEGSIDYSAVAQALRKHNFSGELAIELAHPRELKLTRPLRESLKMSRTYVRKSMNY